MKRSAPQPATRKTPTGGRKMVIITRMIAEIMVRTESGEFVDESCGQLPWYSVRSVLS